MIRRMARNRPLSFLAVHVYLVAILAESGSAWGQSAQVPADVEMRQEAYRTVTAEVDRLYSAFDQIWQSIDKTQFEIDALAQSLGDDPKAMLHYVQDRISFEPYYGSLRGADGTLRSRAGNSLDRSLLLASLLEESGYNVELAVAQLSNDQALTLLQSVGQQVTGQSSPIEISVDLLTSLVQTLGTDIDTLIANVERIENRGEVIADELLVRANEDAEYLLGQLESSDVVFGPPTSIDELIPIVSDHYWVRYEDGRGVWIDLDPTFPGLMPGRVVGESADTFSAHAVPDALQHELEIRLVLTSGAEGNLEDNTLIQHTLVVPELNGRAVSLSIHPVPPPPVDIFQLNGSLNAALASVTEFMPALTIDGELVTGPFVDLNGNLYTSPPGSDEGNAERTAAATAEGLGGLGGALEQLGAEPSPAAGQTRQHIMSVWAEYNIITPEPGGTKSVRTERRTVYARSEANSSVAGTDPAALLWSVELMPMTGPMGGELQGYLQLRSLLAARETVFFQSRAAVGLPVDLRGSVERINSLSPAMLAAGLSDALNFLTSEVFSDLVVVWNRPQLLASEVSLDPLPGQRPKLMRGYDVITLDPPVVALRASNEYAQFATLFGAFANTIEWSLVRHRDDFVSGADPGSMVLNTGEVFRAALSQRVPIAAVLPTADRTNAIAQLSITQADAILIEAALERGRVVIAPSAPVLMPDGETRFGWWEVDPGTGEIVGVMEGGRGQAFAEDWPVLNGVLTVSEMILGFFTCLVPNIGTDLTLSQFVYNVAVGALCATAGIAAGVGAFGSIVGHATAITGIVSAVILIVLSRLIGQAT